MRSQSRRERAGDFPTSVETKFGLTGLALVIFRRRGLLAAGFRTPLHPVTTLLFVGACWLVVIGTFVKSPANSAIGLAILLTGLPAWWFWSRTGARSERL